MTAEQDITYQDLQKFNQDYEQTPASASLGRAVQENGVIAASRNYAAKCDLNRVFSFNIIMFSFFTPNKSNKL